MARAEKAEGTRHFRTDRGKPGAVLFVAVGHEYNRVANANIDAVGRGRNDDALGVRKACSLGPLGAAIDDDDTPTKKRGHAYHRLRVGTRADDEQALGSVESFGEEVRSDAVGWFTAENG